MQNLIYILIVIQLIGFGCNNTDNELIEWNKIKDEKDFSAFFNFALTTENSMLFSNCIDSLEKYKPEDKSLILQYSDYYSESTDSLFHSDYILFDKFEYQNSIKTRNIVFINIDNNDSIETEYSDSSYLDYNRLLFTLFDTIGDSYDLPEYVIVKFDKKEFQARRLICFISCELRPDTLNQRTTWELLLKTNKQILKTCESVRNYKSNEIFSEEFKELNELERKFIINLVPIFIENYFYFSFIHIPPPPPPPSVDIIGDRSV